MHVQERSCGFVGLSLSHPGPRLSSDSLLKLPIFQNFPSLSQMQRTRMHSLVIPQATLLYR